MSKAHGGQRGREMGGGSARDVWRGRSRQDEGWEEQLGVCIHLPQTPHATSCPVAPHARQTREGDEGDAHMSRGRTQDWQNERPGAWSVGRHEHQAVRAAPAHTRTDCGGDVSAPTGTWGTKSSRRHSRVLSRCSADRRSGARDQRRKMPGPANCCDSSWMS